MIITISGTPGSGKSTVRNIVAEKLKLKKYSTGDFMRQMAKERGVTLEELGDLAKINPSVDKELDDWQITLGKKEDDFIIDGRLAFHFIPNSIKIFIDADLRARGARVFKDKQAGLRSEEKESTIEEIMEKMSKRTKVEGERYMKYYGVNPNDHKHFDLVIDSTSIPAVEVAEKVLEFYNSKQHE
jgi:CMP/dCMP kinase